MRKTNPWLNSLLAGDGIKRKALQKEADDLWAESVKLRDKSRCLRCLGTTNLNAHHIFSRKHKATRYILENGITLCRHCHKFEAHVDTELFRRWLIESKHLSQFQYDTLFGLAYGKSQGKPNLPLIIAELRGLRDRMLKEHIP